MSDIGALNLEFSLGIGNALEKLDNIVSKFSNIEKSISDIASSSSGINIGAENIARQVSDIDNSFATLPQWQMKLLQITDQFKGIVPSAVIQQLSGTMFKLTEALQGIDEELLKYLENGEDISKLDDERIKQLKRIYELFDKLSLIQKEGTLQNELYGKAMGHLNEEMAKFLSDTEKANAAVESFTDTVVGGTEASAGLLDNFRKIGNEATRTAGALGVISTTLQGLKADEDDYSRSNYRALGSVRELQQAHMDLQIQYGSTNARAKETITSLAQAGINSRQHGEILEQLIDTNYQLQNAYGANADSVAKYLYITNQFDKSGKETAKTMDDMARMARFAGMSGEMMSKVFDSTAKGAQVLADRFKDPNKEIFEHTRLMANSMAAARDLKVNADDVGEAMTNLFGNPLENARLFQDSINGTNVTVASMTTEMAKNFDRLRASLPKDEDGFVVKPEILGKIMNIPKEQAAALDKMFVKAGGTASEFEAALTKFYGTATTLAAENEERQESLAQTLERLWGALGGTLKRLFEPFIKALAIVLSLLADFLQKIGEAIAKLDDLGIAGDAIKVILGIGVVAALFGVKAGILAILGKIPALISGFGGWLLKVTGLNKALGGVTSKMKNFNKAATDASKQKAAGGGISGFIKGLADGIKYFGTTVTPKHLGILALSGVVLLGLAAGFVLVGAMMSSMGVTAGEMIGLAVALGILALALIGILAALAAFGAGATAALPVLLVAIGVLLALGAALWIISVAFENFAGALETLLPVITANLPAFWSLLAWMAPFTLLAVPFGLAAGVFALAMIALAGSLVTAWALFPNKGMKEMNARFLELVTAASKISAGALNNVVTMGKNMKIVASDLEDAEDDFPTTGIAKMANSLSRFHNAVDKYTLGDALILRSLTGSLVSLGKIDNFNGLYSLEYAAPSLREFTEAAKDSNEVLKKLSNVIQEINQGFSQLETDISVSTEMVKKITAESSTITSVKFTQGGLEVKNDPSKKNSEDTLNEIRKLNKTMEDIRKNTGDSNDKEIVEAIRSSSRKLAEVIEETSENSGSNTGWD